MNFKSPSIAKILTAVFLIFAISSAYFAYSYQAQIKSTTKKLEDEKKKLVSIQSVTQELDKKLSPDTIKSTYSDNLSLVLTELYKQRLEAGISLSTITTSKGGGGSTVTSLSALADTVPGTTIKTTKILIRGNYTDFDGLIKYFDNIVKLPIAIEGLGINQKAFELTLRVYGA